MTRVKSSTIKPHLVHFRLVEFSEPHGYSPQVAPFHHQQKKKKHIIISSFEFPKTQPQKPFLSQFGLIFNQTKPFGSLSRLLSAYRDSNSRSMRPTIVTKLPPITRFPNFLALFHKPYKKQNQKKQWIPHSPPRPLSLPSFITRDAE